MASDRPNTQYLQNIAKTRSSDIIERKEIGQGAFGTVFRATHIEWGPVAYKILSSGKEYIEEETIGDLEKEVLSHAKLHHQNIVQMMAMVYEPNVECGIVMYYEVYGNIQKFLSSFQSVPLRWKLELICHVALGLNYLHTQTPPILHGDLKMLNILVGEGFMGKIGDFGLSVWRTYSTMKTRNDRKVLRGTVTHIAPERLANIHLRLVENADMYSFAILMWEIITESSPFKARSEMEIAFATVNGQRPLVDGKFADVPPEITDMMRSAWSPDATERPTSRDIKKTMMEFHAREQKAISEAKKFLQYQDYKRNRRSTESSNSTDNSDEATEMSSAIPVEVVSHISSPSSVPAVNLSPAGLNHTNSAGPVPCCPSTEITAVQVDDRTKGLSGGNELRHGRRDLLPPNNVGGVVLQSTGNGLMSSGGAATGSIGVYNSRTLPNPSRQAQTRQSRTSATSTISADDININMTSMSTQQRSTGYQVSSAVSLNANQTGNNGLELNNDTTAESNRH